MLCGLLALSVGAGLAQGLTSCQPPERSDGSRPLTTAEAGRLAAMRLQNYRDGRVGVRAVIGPPGRELLAAGWVDWRRPLAYLSVAARTSALADPEQAADPFQPGSTWRARSPLEGLIQAVPGLIATRRGAPIATRRAAGTADASTPSAALPLTVPPTVPPADGWRLRRTDPTTPARAPLDAFVTLLFAGASDQLDIAGVLARSDARWLRRDSAGGGVVDVLLGPAVPPAPPALPAAPAPPTPKETEPRQTEPRQTEPRQTEPRQTEPPRETGSPSAQPDGQPPTSLAAMGGAVRYWIDQRARVHRLEALLADDLPVRVDLLRADRTAPAAIPALGGGAIEPRAVTLAEARQLAGLRQRNQGTGGGRVSLTLPAGQGTARAAGWVDWRNTVTYLRVTGPGQPSAGILVRADRRGLATRPAPGKGGKRTGKTDGGATGAAGDGTRDGRDTHSGPGNRRGTVREQTDRSHPGTTPSRRSPKLPPPPLPPPGGAAWRPAPWSAGGDERGAFDLELLLNELLAVSSPTRDRVEPLRSRATWLRRDILGGRPVSVYELRKPPESRVAPGQARMRYWVGRNGVLRRLELRTRAGAFAQLDIAPGNVPFLPPTPGTALS